MPIFFLFSRSLALSSGEIWWQNIPKNAKRIKHPSHLPVTDIKKTLSKTLNPSVKFSTLPAFRLILFHLRAKQPPYRLPFSFSFRHSQEKR